MIRVHTSEGVYELTITFGKVPEPHAVGGWVNKWVVCGEVGSKVICLFAWDLEDGVRRFRDAALLVEAGDPVPSWAREDWTKYE